MPRCSRCVPCPGHLRPPMPSDHRTRDCCWVTAISIRRGTPVVPSALVPQAARDRLSEQLPDGMRAMTIQVDQLNALSGHLKAGDSVDLYYSRVRGSGAVLVPLMQRVPVLATGDMTLAQLQARTEREQYVLFKR